MRVVFRICSGVAKLTIFNCGGKKKGIYPLVHSFIVVLKVSHLLALKEVDVVQVLIFLERVKMEHR